MNKRELWVDKKFEYEKMDNKYSDLIVRLEKTISILEELTGTLPTEILTKKDGDSWSIQESTGHLLEVEALFTGRLEDYQNHLGELRPADMTNKRTYDADYNKVDIRKTLADFKAVRVKYVEDLRSLPEGEFFRSSFHPRLKKQMRLIDMLFFQAEHDDHHITTMKNLKERFLSEK